MLNNDQIKLVHKTIKKMLSDDSECNILLFVFGQKGMQIKDILNLGYGREEAYIVDDRYARYNPKIKETGFLEDLDCSKYVAFFSVLNAETENVYEIARQYFDESRIYIAIDETEKDKAVSGVGGVITKCGKHSTGPLCNHWLVESVGAFCSFASGCDVVSNHSVNYLSTAPFIFANAEISPPLKLYEYECQSKGCKYALWEKGQPQYVEGIVTQGRIEKFRRINIGNDVWLGHGVLIANGSDIGNGVIAGAGAVITKPVPDYAIVGGVPAKVIRYRYSPDQIAALNKIRWWNWSDEKIKDCYPDFLGSVDEFINKHL